MVYESKDTFIGSKAEWLKTVEERFPTRKIENNGDRYFATVKGKDVACFSIVAGQGYVKEKI